MCTLVLPCCTAGPYSCPASDVARWVGAMLPEWVEEVGGVVGMLREVRGACCMVSFCLPTTSSILNYGRNTLCLATNFFVLSCYRRTITISASLLLTHGLI